MPDAPSTTPHRPSILADWLALARLSNLPTVLSNVLLGLVLGYQAAVQTVLSHPPISPLPALKLVAIQGWPRFILQGCWPIFAAAACLYIAGMIFNDVVDVRYDRVDAPHRPIAAGRVSRDWAFAVVILLCAAAMQLAALVNPIAPWFALALMLCIVAYDVLHKRWAGGVIFMGLSRAMVYLLAASVFLPGADIGWFCWVTLPFAGILCVFTVLLTVVARMERAEAVGKRKWLALAMLPLAMLGAMWVVPSTAWGVLWMSLAAVVLLLWLLRAAVLVTRQPPRTGKAVLTWIGGISLIDAYGLTLTAQPELAAVAGGCFLLTLLLHRFIPGT